MALIEPQWLHRPGTSGGLEDAGGQGFNCLAKDLMLGSAMPGLWE